MGERCWADQYDSVDRVRRLTEHVDTEARSENHLAQGRLHGGAEGQRHVSRAEDLTGEHWEVVIIRPNAIAAMDLLAPCDEDAAIGKQHSQAVIETRNGK